MWPEPEAPSISACLGGRAPTSCTLLDCAWVPRGDFIDTSRPRRVLGVGATEDARWLSTVSSGAFKGVPSSLSFKKLFRFFWSPGRPPAWYVELEGIDLISGLINDFYGLPPDIADVGGYGVPASGSYLAPCLFEGALDLGSSSF